MPRTALFAGSFDPITNGHLDVVRAAVNLADRLVLAVGVHPGKTPLFSAEERLAMLEDAAAQICWAMERRSVEKRTGGINLDAIVGAAPRSRWIEVLQ